ncbi:uncharacterized protein LOC129758653 [Uranotaenia lowii]|uniref:uncharacterized protein LOC129758653 n=1 Tax=Uranotaenia lowii TaxID=190385 RepID=UPI00247866E3|nr:uncharacterized protein LOC129758653 [Uranotaenia lowii]
MNHSSNGSNDLEIILDIYEDGQVKLASSCENFSLLEKSSLRSVCSECGVSRSVSSVGESTVVRLFPRDLPSVREPDMLQVIPESDDEDSEREPELVDARPRFSCDNECCVQRRAGPMKHLDDETVILEANIQLTFPIKRKNLEQLLKLTNVVQRF